MSEKLKSPESGFSGKHLGWLKEHKKEGTVIAAGLGAGILGSSYLLGLGVMNPLGFAIAAAISVVAAMNLFKRGGQK